MHDRGKIHSKVSDKRQTIEPISAGSQAFNSEESAPATKGTTRVNKSETEGAFELLRSIWEFDKTAESEIRSPLLLAKSFVPSQPNGKVTWDKMNHILKIMPLVSAKVRLNYPAFVKLAQV